MQIYTLHIHTHTHTHARTCIRDENYKLSCTGIK